MVCITQKSSGIQSCILTVEVPIQTAHPYWSLYCRPEGKGYQGNVIKFLQLQGKKMFPWDFLKSRSIYNPNQPDIYSI